MTARTLCRFTALVALALAAGRSPALAQDRPTIFLHGFHSVGSDWADAAARMRSALAIDSRTPDLPWRQTYEQQAQALGQSPAASSLPMAPILVGHSNGGVVAREFGRTRAVNGIATIGTPHHGAPIVPAFGVWLTFQASAPALLEEVVSSFAQPSDLTWTFGSIQGGLGWVSDFSIWSVVYLASVLGLDASMPVAAEMAPGSSYLSGLNSSANLQHEAAAIPGRVGVVSIAHEYYWAGPARAIFPAGADGVAAALYGTAYGLLYWGSYIMSESDPTDTHAMRQAMALIGLGNFLLSIDPMYCRLVSGAPGGECLPNDGVVPYTSQEFPGAPNIFMGLDDSGPAHTQERDWGEGVLADALSSFMHVPARGTTTPPPLLSPGSSLSLVISEVGVGSGSSGGGGDSGGGGSIPVNDSGYVESDERLPVDRPITSNDGRFHFQYQDDGNLVLYDEHGSPLWASQSAGTSVGMAAMQADGNLVVYNADLIPVWASGTAGHPNAYLLVQDDGNVVVYDTSGRPLWATNTCCR